MTIVINIVGAPGAGKTTIASAIFSELKMLGLSVEYVPEFAKQLVWLERFDLLNNQHYVSGKQYNYLKSIDGKVDYIVTDGCMVHGLYYNRFNVDNFCNIKKTDDQILKWNQEFDNMYIHLEKGDFPYEQVGRMQTEEESMNINYELIKIMDELAIERKSFKTERKIIPRLLQYILWNDSDST